MAKTELPKISTDILPEDWRKRGAEKFNCSISTIEKVVYGVRQNTKIYDYMLELAEELRLKNKQREDRLNALTA